MQAKVTSYFNLSRAKHTSHLKESWKKVNSKGHNEEHKGDCERKKAREEDKGRL